MHIVSVRLFRGLAALVLSALVSACSGLTVSEGLFSQTARVEGEKPSGQVGVYLQVAQEALEARDYATAIRFYETILDRTPGNLAAVKGVAVAYSRDGRIGQAVNAWRVAMALAPDDQLIQENLGNLLNAETLPAAGLPSPPPIIEPESEKIRLFMDLEYSGRLPEKNSPATNLAARPVIHTTIDEARSALQSVADKAMEQELELAGLGDIAPAAGNPFLLFNPATSADRPVRTASTASTVPGIPDSAPARVDARPRAQIVKTVPDATLATPTAATPAVPERSRKREEAGATAGMSPESGQYRVQLAAYRSAGHARRGIAIFRRLMGQVGTQLEILERRHRGVGSTAVNFRIRTAALGGRQAAVLFCASVRALGQECLAIRHGTLSWQAIA